jgi:hypothetical protein
LKRSEPLRGTVARWRAPQFAVVATAVVVGAALRLDQIGAQVLIDDEWHAVHQVLQRTPREMLLDFGFADYSIPLGIVAWFESRAFGLSELVMRAPMLVCGLVTLAALPLYVARRLPPTTVAVFAWLIAISPLLVVYSRMARPYAITLLLGWTAHAAFQRFWTSASINAGALYVASSALACWLHPVVAPFVVAPVVWATLESFRSPRQAMRARLVRLAGIALPAALAIAALIMPPLVAHPFSLTLKSGVDIPNLDTVVGATFAWLGTPHGAVVVLCLALAALGARDVARALPEARTGALGIALTAGAVVAMRPAWSSNAIAFARYLLPLVPLMLLAIAAGTTIIARRVGAATSVRRALAAALAAAPCVALAAQSPMIDMLRRPNSHTLHLLYHFDFRPARNAYLPYIAKIPLSPFWATLRARPGGLVVAAAPFHFESYNWDAPRWERVSGQRVVPGFLSGLCVVRRYGEIPADPAFRFRNAVHLADDREIAARHIDYVVWQKPFAVDGQPDPVGVPTAHCEVALRERFGAPAYEDESVVAFRVRPAGAEADAAR